MFLRRGTVHEKHDEEDDVLALATVLIHRPCFSVAACVILGFVHALVHVGARLAYWFAQMRLIVHTQALTGQVN